MTYPTSRNITSISELDIELDTSIESFRSLAPTHGRFRPWYRNLQIFRGYVRYLCRKSMRKWDVFQCIRPRIALSVTLTNRNKKRRVPVACFAMTALLCNTQNLLPFIQSRHHIRSYPISLCSRMEPFYFRMSYAWSTLALRFIIYVKLNLNRALEDQ